MEASWHPGEPVEASAVAFTQSYGDFQRAACQQEPSYRVKGVLTDGFDSTTKSMRTLFPGARLGNCLRHALNNRPRKLVAITSPCARPGPLATQPPSNSAIRRETVDRAFILFVFILKARCCSTIGASE